MGNNEKHVFETVTESFQDQFSVEKSLLKGICSREMRDTSLRQLRSWKFT